jgi:hypothetical protein
MEFLSANVVRKSQRNLRRKKNWSEFLILLLFATIDSVLIVHMNKRSNMNASTAKIASRTKMRLNDIKIPSTSGVIPGPAPRCPTIVLLSTTHQLVPLKRTLAGIVGKSLLGLLQVSRVWTPKLPWNMIERQEFSIWWSLINLGSVTTRKNSFAQITSGNIWSTVMLERVESGPTCWKMLAWKMSHYRSPILEGSQRRRKIWVEKDAWRSRNRSNTTTSNDGEGKNWGPGLIEND